MNESYREAVARISGEMRGVAVGLQLAKEAAAGELAPQPLNDAEIADLREEALRGPYQPFDSINVPREALARIVAHLDWSWSRPWSWCPRCHGVGAVGYSTSEPCPDCSGSGRHFTS